MQQVKSELDKGVFTLTLARSEKLNALNTDMYTALADHMEQAERDPKVSVLLLKAEGDAFCAGNDIGDFLHGDESVSKAILRFIKLLTEMETPIVAAVQGAAVGIGTTMLLHCDQVFASTHAGFSMPFIDHGLCPEAGSSLLLPQLMGYQRAAEWLMSGRRMSAIEARDVGLVMQICKPEDLQRQAAAAAQDLAAKPRAALRATKRLLRRASEPLSQRVGVEADTFRDLLASEEARRLLEMTGKG